METTKDIFSPYISGDKLETIQSEMDSEWEKVASAGGGWKANLMKGIYEVATKMFLPMGGMMGGMYAANKMISREKDSRLEKLKEQIAVNRAELIKRPTFTDEQERFSGMFDEIQEIAPNVAANSIMIDKIMSAHINEPLDLTKLQALRHLDSSLSESFPDHRVQMIEGMGLAAGKNMGQSIRSEVDRFNTPPRLGSGANPMHMQFHKTGSAGDIKSQESMGRMAYNHFEFLSNAYNSTGFNKTAGIFDKFNKNTYDKIKKSGIWSMILGGAKAVAAPAAVATAGYGLYSMGKNRRDKDMREQLLDSYQIVDKAKELEGMDGKLREDAFNALSTFAPSIAAKPIAAKTFLSMVQTRGGVDPDLLRQITQIEQGHKQTQAIDSYGGFMSNMSSPFQISSNIQRGMPTAESAERASLYGAQAQKALSEAGLADAQVDRFNEAR